MMVMMMWMVAIDVDRRTKVRGKATMGREIDGLVSRSGISSG